MMNEFSKSFMTSVVMLTLSAGSASLFAVPNEHMSSDEGRHAAYGKLDREKMRERMVQRQTELHDKLGLNAQQEAAWRTYIESMQSGSSTRKRPDRAAFAQLSVPERMERKLAMMNEREKRMEQRLADTKDFYEALTRQQQEILIRNSMQVGTGGITCARDPSGSVRIAS